jgi:hypothetical protein
MRDLQWSGHQLVSGCFPANCWRGANFFKRYALISIRPCSEAKTNNLVQQSLGPLYPLIKYESRFCIFDRRLQKAFTWKNTLDWALKYVIPYIHSIQIVKICENLPEIEKQEQEEMVKMEFIVHLTLCSLTTLVSMQNLIAFATPRLRTV